MKAMVLEKYGEWFQLKDVNTPEPGPAEVLLKVKSVGVCATDLKLKYGKFSTLSLPVIPGHEISAKVMGIGQNVREFDFGDRVVVYIYIGCGKCRNCLSGHPNICVGDVKRFGLERDGGFAEYVVCPAANLLKIPENLSYTEACVIPDAVSTCVHALRDRISLKKGDNILILGSGGLGMNALQIAKYMGATVTVSDISEEKLKIAKHYGADYVFNNSRVDLRKESKKITGGYGMDFVGEFVGLPETSRTGFECLGFGGTMVTVGYSPGEMLCVDNLFMFLGERTITSSRAMTKENVAEGLNLVAEGFVTPLIDSTNPLEKINEVLEKLASGNIKGRAVIIVDDTE